MGWILLFFALAGGAEPERCHSTIFATRGDKWAGGPTRCLKPARRVRETDRGIAHRTLKCGTRVIVVNPRTHRVSVTRVIDHGPYGAMYESRWLVKRRRSDPGVWRGCADLTPPVARELGHNGFERVWVVALPLERHDGLDP